MDQFWQMSLTLLIVAAAAGHVALRIWRLWRGTDVEKGCGGGCVSCPAATTESSPQLIQLEWKTPNSAPRG
jgi:hypothetical protein